MAHSKTTLKQNIQVSAGFLQAFDLHSLKAGRMEKSVAETLLRECWTCLAGLASAMQQGMDENDDVLIALYGQTEPQTMTLAQLQAWCLVIRNLTNEHLFRARIQQALLQANVWVDDLRECNGLSQEQALFAAETGRCLLQVLRDAQAAGVSERALVELNGKMVTLAEVRKLGQYVAAASDMAKP